MAKVITCFAIEEDMLAEVDKTARAQAKSRSRILRDAVSRFVEVAAIKQDDSSFASDDSAR